MVVFTYFIKRAREIRKFHVVVVQRRQRNVQKTRDSRAKLLFFNINILFFAVLLAVAVVVGCHPDSLYLVQTILPQN